jgi:hypothetical protein
MNNEQLTVELKHILAHLNLNDVQETVLIKSFFGHTYSKIASENGYNCDYIKEVGANLWKFLSVKLQMKVSKKNIRMALRKQI